jgi:hypothetical protein
MGVGMSVGMSVWISSACVVIVLLVLSGTHTTTVLCTALYSVLHCTVLHCTALYCTVVHCTALY